MARNTDAAVNVLRDAIVRVLKTIGTGGRSSWLTVPATIEALPKFKDAHADLPAIFVQCVEISESQKLGAGLHESAATFVVWLMTKNEDDPDGELHRLASDVARALTSAEATLEALAPAGLDCLGYTFDAEASERFGLATGKQRWRLGYRWTHENP